MADESHKEPCPFCGCIPWGHGQAANNTVSVWCQVCGTRGPAVDIAREGPEYHQIQQAYDRWNQRK